jgi:class 3 adenylate cyclase
VLTGIAVTMSAFSPWAVALLLFPLLYLWPQFNERLDARLYPKRAHFAELARAMIRELGTSTSVEAVLRVLATTPERLLDARSAVAFLLPGVAADKLQVVTRGGVDPEAGPSLAEEPLIQLLSATRKELLRDGIALQPQYANVEAELTACLDRLEADAILPLLDDEGHVVGGLAIGTRESRDPYEPFELDVLSAVVQQAYESIAHVQATDRLHRREHEFADLKRFFPPQIIDQVLADGGAVDLRRRRKPVTVVFADLRGFTAFSDSVEPEEVAATLSGYHAAMGVHIEGHGGTLERFTGDGFMVFFNDPIEQPDHIERAARMALAMRESLGELRESWQRKGYRIDMGIGIHTGYATCGFVGYEGRRDYGVIGRVTNLASRLSDTAPSGEILISSRVRAELPEAFVTEPAGELELKGFSQAQAAHHLVAHRTANAGA